MRTGYFYPRINYNSVNIDFDDTAGSPAGPCNLIVFPPTVVRGENYAASGAREVLVERIEYTMRMQFLLITKARLDSLWTYWSTWGALGKQAAITLDRNSGCGGQWEYDQFNTFFNKAENVDQSFQPARTSNKGPLYGITLNFRQGQ